MTVYAVAQMKIRDGKLFHQFQSRLFKILYRFDGCLVASDNNPTVIGGDWNKDSLAIMKFPDVASFDEMVNSNDYAIIAKDADAAAVGGYVLVEEATGEVSDDKSANSSFFFADEVLTASLFAILWLLLGLVLFRGVYADGTSLNSMLNDVDWLLASLATASVLSISHFANLRRYRR